MIGQQQEHEKYTTHGIFQRRIKISVTQEEIHKIPEIDIFPVA